VQSGDAGKAAEIKAVEFLKREIPAFAQRVSTTGWATPALLGTSE
jgi:hypothetical protein